MKETATQKVRQKQTLVRRSGTDRRMGPTNPFSLASLRGRRRHVRRTEDLTVHYYIDRYSWRVVAAVVATMALCTLDAFLTLKLVASGGKELNPVMDYYIRLGSARFVMVKYLTTAGSLLLLVVHKDYRMFNSTFPAKYLLAAMPILYGFLIVYELSLFP